MASLRNRNGVWQARILRTPTLFAQKTKGGCFPRDQLTSSRLFATGGVARTVLFEQITVHSPAQ